MSQKRAKERRRDGTDRRRVSERNQIAGLLKPKSARTQIDLGTYAAYKAVERQLDDLLLGEDGLLRILPARVYAEIPRVFLMLWAKEMGYHLFPTAELVDWLRDEIGDRAAIEICAGAGVLGRALGVPCIDWDVCHRFPAVQLFYAASRDAIPAIGGHCENLEALEAVAKYQPEVVFGGYITQRSCAGEPTTMSGSFAGVDERTLIRCVRKYIVMGSLGTHGDKKIWRDRSRQLSPEWLVTRTPDPANQVIAVWENPNPLPVREVLRIPENSGIPIPVAAPAALASQTAGALSPSARMLR